MARSQIHYDSKRDHVIPITVSLTILTTRNIQEIFILYEKTIMILIIGKRLSWDSVAWRQIIVCWYLWISLNVSHMHQSGVEARHNISLFRPYTLEHENICLTKYIPTLDAELTYKYHNWSSDNIRTSGNYAARGNHAQPGGIYMNWWAHDCILHICYISILGMRCYPCEITNPPVLKIPAGCRPFYPFQAYF